MARTERQLQATYDKGKISLSEFHEALSKIGTAQVFSEFALIIRQSCVRLVNNKA